MSVGLVTNCKHTEEHLLALLWTFFGFSTKFPNDFITKVEYNGKNPKFFALHVVFLLLKLDAKHINSKVVFSYVSLETFFLFWSQSNYVVFLHLLRFFSF